MLTQVFSLYYRYASLLNRVAPTMVRDGRRFRVLPTVYKSVDHEERLADYCRPGHAVLDVGSGAGVISVGAALRGARVTAVDINPRCVANTRLNARAHGVAVECLLSDLYDAVPGRRFDRIISAAPYLDFAMDDPAERWGTSQGFVPRLIAGAREHLSARGLLVLVYPFYARARVERLARDAGLRLVRRAPTPRWSPRVALTKLAYLQPLVRARVFVFARDDC